ncbi:hypothetical protein BHE74_00041197 [Ensete ventricosum]|nr:hypothetical protein GW17_00043020 [Ensete ventricosum]RWW52382.1 hypothetical protein BHE74_00041197 [Ensete ventricosum]RZS07613.1 hypothetical protein BHM03_00038479 [Ensete ventricosum]
MTACLSCTTTGASYSQRLLSSRNTRCHTVALLFLACNPTSPACNRASAFHYSLSNDNKSDVLLLQRSISSEDEVL